MSKTTDAFDEERSNASKYLNDPEKLRKLAEDATKKTKRHGTGPLKKLLFELKAMIRMLIAYWKGTYRDIPWQSLVAIVAAVAYFVSPIDLIPDFIPLFGFTDDAAVVAIAVQLVRGDIDEFLAWEENNA